MKDHIRIYLYNRLYMGIFSKKWTQSFKMYKIGLITQYKLKHLAELITNANYRNCGQVLF